MTTCVLPMFLSPLAERKHKPEAVALNPISINSHVCKVLTFHVVQSIAQHLEHGHIEGITECSVVEISTGVGLQERQRHVTTSQKPSSGPPPSCGDPVK